MKMLIGAAALALLMFGTSGGAEASAAESPPPPFDWDTPAQDFAPFYAIGPDPADGVWHHIEWAVTPAEGRALCDHYKQWDMHGELIDCLVKPLSEQPDVTQPGWADEFAPPWAG